MTTNIGSLAVSLSLDASNFNGSMAQVDRNLRSMGSELKAAKAMGTDYGKSLDGLRSKKDILSRSVEASTIKLTEERKKYDELVASGKANEAQLERQAKKVNDAQANYNRLTTELGEVDKALKIQSSSWTQAGEKMENAGKKMQSIGKGMTTVGDGLSKSVTAPVIGLGTAAFKAAVDFESAFAGVRKTVDMSEAEFATLSDGIRNMAKELPAAATEIANVAANAGQLGIKNEAILGFTRTMTDLGVATNMSSEEASTALARLANITQMNQQDFDRLGSSVVALGNNFATTEREIVDMALRLAGAGAQVGMSEADILGLSSALSSVGIEAEMGGSAISKAIIRMQVASTSGFTELRKVLDKTGLTVRDLQMMASHSGKAFNNLSEDLGMTKKELSALLNAGVDLENFAKIAGMTGEEFKTSFETDAVGALGAFINGLGGAEAAGESAITMLQEMGISEVRLRDSLLRAGNASELFAGAVDLSNVAWDENNALTKEAEERYKTTASQMKILWNRITDIGISFGEILIPMAQQAMDKIGGLVDKFASLDDKQQKNIVKMAGLAAAIGPVLSISGRLTTGLGSTLLIAGNLSKGIAGAGGLVASIGALAGPAAIAVGAIAAIGVAGYGLYKVLNQTSIPEIDIFGDTVSDNTKKAVGAFTKLTDEASVQLGLLQASGMKVSEEMAGAMVKTFNQMGDTILADMKEDHAAQLEAARNHLAATVTLTEEEQGKLLSVIVDGQAEREAKVESAQKQYTEILDRASKERRGLTKYEQSELDKLQSEMKETGIKYLSETEAEAMVILERLKLESGKINAEQAIETAKRAREAKEAVVEEAEKKYDETIKWAQFLKEDGSKESLALYEAIVKDAENTRDETIKATEDQYDEVIRITKEKGDEFVTETELRLGRVLTNWEKFSIDVSKETLTMSVKVRGHIMEMAVEGGTWFAELRRTGITSVTDLVRGYDLAVNKLPGIMKNMLIDAVAEVGKSIANFFTAGENVAQGLIDGVKSKAKDVAVEGAKLGVNLIKSAKDALQVKSPSRVFIGIGEDVGTGLAIGVDSTKAANEKAVLGVAKVLSNAARKNADEVSKIAEEAEKKRTEIQTEYAKKRADLSTKNSKTYTANLVKLKEDEQKKLAAINEKAWADMVKKENEVSKDRLEAVKTYVADKKSLNELSLVAEAEVWRKSLALFNEGTKERVEIQKGYQAALKAINDEVTKTNEEYAKKMTTINDKLREEEKKLTDEYTKTLNDRISSLRNFAGIFDEIDITVKKSGSELLANLQGQVSAFTMWQQQIDLLATKAIDGGLLAELREMGPKALPELLALNSLTDTQLTQYSALYVEKSKLAREQAEKELVGMKNDTQARITELRATANTELEALRNEWVLKIQSITKATNDELSSLKQIGVNAGQGLLDGLASMEDSLVDKARSIANAISAAMASALQVKSPSRVTMKIGEHVGEGLMVGMENMLSDIKRVSARMGEFAVPSLPNIQGGLVAAGMGSVNARQAATNSPTYTGPIYVSIDGKDFDNMRDITDFFSKLPQAQRSQ